jgi:hypothetical protein
VEVAAAVTQAQLKIQKIKTNPNNRKLQPKIIRTANLKKLKQNLKKYLTMKKKKNNKLSMKKKSQN